MPPKHIQWNPRAHEAGVEKFYGTGVEKYGDFHGNYLNFGLWENGITDYVEAAENLVLHMGRLLGLDHVGSGLVPDRGVIGVASESSRRRTAFSAQGGSAFGMTGATPNGGAQGPTLQTSPYRLLDVACGMGAQDVLLYKTFGCQIDAVDVTWKHVEHATQRVRASGLSPVVRVHHGTATKLPFADVTFTHVTSIEGPEHFNTREDFFREAYRALKPGGIMVLSDYNLHRKPRNLWEHMVVEAARILWHVPRANYDTIDSYKMKLERSGFCNVLIEEIGERVIPGYYFEQQRPETKKALRKIRGLFGLYGGLLIDYILYRAYRAGLINYILVRAEK